MSQRPNRRDRIRRWLHFRGVHRFCREVFVPVPYYQEFIVDTEGRKYDVTNQGPRSLRYHA